jgi:hypothetical protein
MTVAPPAGVVSEAGMTGSGLRARIKKDQRFADVPLILLLNLKRAFGRG